MTGHGDTRRTDAVRVKRSDQTLEWSVSGSPGRVFQVVAQTVHATVFSGSAFHAGQKRWADFAHQSLRGVDLRQTLLDVFVAQAVAAKRRKVREMLDPELLINSIGYFINLETFKVSKCDCIMSCGFAVVRADFCGRCNAEKIAKGKT